MRTFIVLMVLSLVSISLIDSSAWPSSHVLGEDQPQSPLKLSQPDEPLLSGSEDMDLFSSGVKMIASLAFVLAGILLTYWVMRKFLSKNTRVFGGGSLIRTLATSYIGPKKAVSIVEVAGEVLVLGISDNEVSLLTKIEDVARAEAIKSACDQSSPLCSFEGQLKRMSSKFKRNTEKDVLSELTNSFRDKVSRLKDT